MSLKLGMVGAGFIGNTHSYLIRRALKGGMLDAELTAAFDLDPTRLKSHENYGWPAANSVAEVCEKSDAVWVCVPTASHLEVVRAAVEAGCAVFCEKPLGRNLEEATEIVEVAASVPNQVGLILRWTPPFRIAKKWIDEGRVGRIQGIDFNDDQYLPVKGVYKSKWRGDAAIAGSGVLLEHSIHDVDLIEWLGGRIAWVDAETRSFLDVAPGIEDFASVQMGHESGAVASLLTAWHDVASRENDRYIIVVGTEGVIVISHEYVGPIEIWTDSGVERLELREMLDVLFDFAPPWHGESDPLEYVCNEDAHFINAVLEGVTPYPGFELALRAHELIEAAYESARTGSRVLV